MKLLHLLFIFIVSFISASAQDSAQFYDSNFLRYEDFIYRKNIKTIQLQRADYEFSAPVIQLGSAEQLKLSFDDLDADSKNYRFTIIHCDANWNPTDHIMQSEYISGFFDDNIVDYQYGSNTIQRYVHYELLFPTENLKPTKCGNYLLKVFLDYDQNNLVLTKRFMVLDDRVQIIPDLHRPSIIDDYDYKQEIDFTIQTNGYQITNAYDDLKVVITQNDRFDNAITKLKPTFVKNTELVYDYDRDNVFPGGSEFRAFDFSSVKWLSERVQNITFDTSRIYNVYLYPDKSRNHLHYFSEVDKNGKYKINRTESSPNASVTEAEYAYVHFILSMKEPLDSGNVYVFGGLTDWKYSNANKMHYNKALSQYELTLYLKQGYYNYEYIYLKDNEKSGDETCIEGSHYETENDYCIYVYYKPISSNFDQLVGMKRFNSRRF
ncbi:MAG TPA: DUF5103 domain-containing protein [Bacteroidia bacterium]